MNERDSSEVKSAVRVLELLELLSRAEEPMTLRAIVSELGYPKSSTFNLLATLISRAYVVRIEPESYKIHDAFRNGPGWASGRDAQLIATAQPIMDALRDQEGETVFLGTRRRDGRVRILSKSVSRQAVRFDSDLCGTDPAYCTAMGRVLLASWASHRVDAYLARERLVKITDYTVIDRVQLRKIFDETRRNGFGVSDQEAVPGGSGVAAPVRDSSGEVIAALNIATVAPRFDSCKDRLAQAAIRNAAELSYRLGFRGSITSEK